MTLSGMSEVLFENAPCGYITMQKDGRILRVNKAFEKMTGRGRDWLLAGKRFSDLLPIAGRMYLETHVVPLLELQGFNNEVAMDLLRAEGKSTPTIVNAMVYRAADDMPPLILLAVFDATERRSYERELMTLKRRAEEAVIAERASRALAEQAVRGKEEFLAMVTHELRTPLNAILGWTQILQGEGGLTPEQAEALSVIERNAIVQSQLINDLLDMSRIAAGKMRLEVQQLALAQVVTEAIATVKPGADAKGIRLQSVLDPTIIVAGDPGRLQQVFWNLLINAIKFTPKGGFVRVVMQRVNSHIEISVADNGQGMSPAFLQHAFERFRQSESSETQKSAGLGLGLSIVRSIVELHGGTVVARSDGEQKGSMFIVHLPLYVVHPFEDGAEKVHPHSALSVNVTDVRGVTLRGVNVLVVDDHEDARRLLEKVLSDAGATVKSARSSSAALASIERNRPDVLISDIGMADEDGYELIRKIRMIGDSGGRIEAIALTAFVRAGDRTKALLSGFQMHLGKPVDARELIAAVATLAVKRE